MILLVPDIGTLSDILQSVEAVLSKVVRVAFIWECWDAVWEKIWASGVG